MNTDCVFDGDKFAFLDQLRHAWNRYITCLRNETRHIVTTKSVLQRLIRYVTPLGVINSPGKPISENTLNATLRRLGYTKEEVCSHGFRSTASTLLNELERFNPDAIEAQLVHRSQEGAVRAAYLKGEFFEERVQMMTWWSDYLERLAA